jgi:hypothetical protein
MIDSVSVQFFNAGDDATFDAVLRLYQVGSPVGSLIGGPFSVSNQFISSFDILTVTFSNLTLLVPKNLVLTVAVNNVSNGADLGVNLFNPPTIGASSPQFFITYDGTDFFQSSTLEDFDNVYLQIEGTTVVPEPATGILTISAIGLLGWFHHRNRKNNSV